MRNGELPPPVPPDARLYQGETAGLLTRLLATAVDVLTVVALLVAVYFGYNGLRFTLDPRNFQFTASSVVLSVTAAAIVLVLYLTAAWAITGRTYGDQVMGLRVVDSRGGRVRLVVALARALACVAFPLGLLWCAGGRSRRSLQDLLLRTSVVYDWRYSATGEPPGLPADAPATQG